MAYPPKQPGQQGQQQDPLLSGLLSQPQQKSQPQSSQTGDWGGGNNWWAGKPSGGPGGIGGVGPAEYTPPAPPTTGYGTYGSNPNTPGTPPPETPPADPGTVQQGTPTPTQQGPQSVDPNLGYQQMLQQQMVQAQGQLALAQQQLAATPNDMKTQMKVQQAQYTMQNLQNKLNQSLLQSQQGGY